MKLSEPFEGRVVTLLLGDRDFALRHQNFVNYYRGDPQEDAGTRRCSICAWKIALPWCRSEVIVESTMPSRTTDSPPASTRAVRARAACCARWRATGSAIWRTALAASAGWHKGRVVDQVAVAESMRAAMTDAERGAGGSAESVTLGIGGTHIHGAQSRGMYEFGRPREITARRSELRRGAGLRRAVWNATACCCTCCRRISLWTAAPDYRKPHKGVCSRLEANVHIVTASMQEHQALIAAAHLAHLPVEETVFEPLAAAYACLLPEDRARGVAVVDLGNAIHRPGDLRRRRDSACLQPSGGERSLHARHRLGVQGHLRRRRVLEAAVRLRAAGPDLRFEPDRGAFARGPPSLARGAAAS